MKREQRISDELKSINKVLDTFSLEDVTAAIFLDVRKSKENGDYPVKIRVTHKRKQAYYPSQDISIDEWETLISGKKPRGVLLETKKLIYITFQTIIDIIKDLAPGKHFTIQELNMRLSKGTENSILDTFKNKVDSLKKEGRIGSSVWYSCAKNSIEKYVKKDLKFSEVTPEWLQGYQEHLKKEGKKDTTVSINMRALKAVINYGISKGIITKRQYPFGDDKYQIPTGEGQKLALTIPQLMQVFNYSISPENEKWRDLWIFSFYCNGANLNDILRFKYENIEGNTIKWYRQKTIKQGKKKRLIKATITREMKEIIDTYGNHNHNPSNYIFPYLNDRLTPTEARMIVQNVTHNVNKKMKKIGENLGIKKLTTYAARHSYASISRFKKVPLYDISKSMGHATLKTTDIYLDSLSDDELIKNASKMPRRQK